MIFMAALAPIAGLYAWSLKNTTHSFNKTTALFLAQAKMEELKAVRNLTNSFAGVATYTTRKLNGVTFTQEFFQQSETLNSAKNIRVQVRVEWQNGSENNQVSLVTYFKE
jgi:Tfp pilus assembly protein PilV